VVLRTLAPDLWVADGPPVRFLGLFDYPTRMAVVRLADGGLWVWSPVALSEELAAEVEALGPVRHLVAPNKLHHLFLEAWSRRFPEARLYAAPGLAGKRPDLAFDVELDDAPVSAWQGQIDHVIFRGSFALEEVVFLHRPSRSALVCDLIQRFDPATLRGWRGAWLRLWGLAGEDGSTPLEWRASFLRRDAARAALARVLAWDPERLVIAHGLLPEENGRAALERGLRWLA
jgi:hypothetical protein